VPRLIGKQSNSGWYVGSILILAIAIAGVFEYTGFINVIPGFGREYRMGEHSPMDFRRWLSQE
jgi:hypothetical protein